MLKPKFLNSFESHSKLDFFLPNSVAVLKNGDVIVADGGNNRICKFSIQGEELESFGKYSFGSDGFREPVGVFCSPRDEIFVADWHNHRLVVLSSDLKYLTEVGHWGRYPFPAGFWENYFQFFEYMKNLAYRGSYITRHFSSRRETKRPKYSFKRLIQGLKETLDKSGNNFIGLWRYISDTAYSFQKPNGCTFWDDNLAITLKNSSRIVIYRKTTEGFEGPEKEICHLEGSNGFGRLGNIYRAPDGSFYVCDESNDRIVVLDSEFRLVKEIKGENSTTGRFQPFSCLEIEPGLLAVVGGHSLQFILTETREVILHHKFKGELHGLGHDALNQLIYLVDRSKGRIWQLRYSHG